MQSHEIKELQAAFDSAMTSLEAAGSLLGALVWAYGVGTEHERVLEIGAPHPGLVGVHVHGHGDGWSLTAYTENADTEEDGDDPD